MKKKLVITFVCLTLFAKAGYAQDIITKQDGNTVKAKILEVGTESVRYKDFGRPNGPDYVLAASEIFMIKYEATGNKDVFEKNPTTGKIQIRHIVAEKKNDTPSSAPVQQPATGTGTTPSTTASPAPARETAGQTGTRMRRLSNGSNGTFELLGFDGANLSFRAVVETPIYMVSLVAGGRTVKATTIMNTKGDMFLGNGATAIEGSSLLLGKSGALRLQRATEAQCSFAEAPAGFKARTIVFHTGKNAVPMSYDIAAGSWTKPKQEDDKAQTPILSKPADDETKDLSDSLATITEPAQEQEQEQTTTETEAQNEPAMTISFPGGSCRLEKVDLKPRFAPASMSREKEKSFAVSLKYTLDDRTDKALDILYNNGRFVAPDGTEYNAGAALRKDSIYILVVAVPKNVDVSTLKYVFYGQELSLRDAVDN